MANRRGIKGALHNFLGTFLSRNSDFDGYWVFGFLVEGMDAVTIDLLNERPDNTEATAFSFVHKLAAQKFNEQIVKAGLPKTWFRESRLVISKPADSTLGLVNGCSASGFDLKFLAQAVTELGRTYESRASIFVAPHNPKIESRSARAAKSRYSYEPPVQP